MEQYVELKEKIIEKIEIVTDKKDLIGKTIVDVFDDNEIILAFDDGSISIIEVNEEDLCSSVSFDDPTHILRYSILDTINIESKYNQYKNNVPNSPLGFLIKNGQLKEEDIIEYIKIFNEYRTKKNDEIDFNKYLKLKEKFEKDLNKRKDNDLL